MTENRTYRVSATLINSWLYYLDNKTPSQLEKFKKDLQNVFVSNKWILRGVKFEKEVYDGKHGKLSELVSNLEKQKRYKKEINVKGLNIEIVGKPDAVDEERKRIYDIKRVDEFSPNKYNGSVQHLLYFFLNDKIDDFYYLVVDGEGNRINKTNVIHFQRPPEDELKETVIKYVEGFLDFLNENNLLDMYKQHHINKERTKITVESIQGE